MRNNDSLPREPSGNPRALALTGQHFGLWSVISRAANGIGGRSLWLCCCRCGTERIVVGKSLRRGDSTGCGCVRYEALAKRLFRHGQTCSRPGKHRAAGTAWQSWAAMKDRCLRPSHTSYQYYGAVGVTICARWLDSFDHFLSDMGNRPRGLTLDRINNDRGYEPGNCRWATTTQQSRNQKCHAGKEWPNE